MLRSSSIVVSTLALSEVAKRPISTVRSDFPAVAIDKILRSAERRVVGFADGIDKMKLIAEFIVHRFGAITYNIQAAAFLRTFETEGCDDNMPAEFE